MKRVVILCNNFEKELRNEAYKYIHKNCNKMEVLETIEINLDQRSAQKIFNKFPENVDEIYLASALPITTKTDDYGGMEFKEWIISLYPTAKIYVPSISIGILTDSVYIFNGYKLVE